MENNNSSQPIENRMSNDEKKEREIVFTGKTDRVYKVIVIGDPGVGKTEFLAKFTNQFVEKYLPTVGVSLFKTTIELKDYNATVNLIFWDLAGQPQFHMLHRPYFNGADGMLLVFDITRSSTFSNINNWYSAAVKYGLSEIPRILIGNKAHLKGERKIILPMAAHLAEKLNAHYYETSPLSRHNVNEAFEKIAELIHRAKELDEPEKDEKLIIKPYQGKIIEIPDKNRSKPAFRIIKEEEKYKPHSSNFPRPSYPYRPYKPQTIRSKKEKKKLAKEKKKHDKEKTKLEKEKKNIEKREKQGNLIEAMKNEYDYLFKSIVVGDAGVGKTALSLRFSKGPSTEDLKRAIGVGFYIKTISIETEVGPIKAKLQIWDTGEQEKFTSLRSMYYRDSLGAVLVFDLTNASSFEHLPLWIEDVLSNVKSEIPLLLVGNKSDLIDQRQVSLEEINTLTRDFNLYYTETSAKTGEGVDYCFYILACLMLGVELPKRLKNTNKKI